MEWEVGYVGLQLSCLSIKSRHEAEREKIKKKICMTHGRQMKKNREEETKGRNKGEMQRKK